MSYENKDLLNGKLKQLGNKPFIAEKINGEWQSKSYTDFIRDVKSFAARLQHDGLMHGKIAIFANNSYAYLVADAAIMGYIGISIPISKEWTVYSLKNAVRNLNIDAIIYDHQHANIVKQFAADNLIKTIAIEEIIEPNDYKLAENTKTADEISKIVFSSGTTGTPKAVALSQHNMFANFENLRKRTPMDENDIDYLFLPLSHTYACISNFYYALISGMKLYLCSDTKKITEELLEVRPTIFCAVPLIFERLYATCTENNLDPNTILGGRIRHLFVGGANLNPEICAYFKKHHTGLVNTYGLSETSAIVAVEYHNENDFESSGTIFENQEVKIDQPDENGVGEILVKGENIMQGYYGNKELTHQVFDSDNYFHTGDLGLIRNNKIYIRGRKKRLILLSNGENIYPDDIEPLFEKYPHIVKTKIYEKDKTIFATFYCDEEIDLEPIVDEVNDELPKYARIRNYELVRDEIGTRLK